MKKAVIITGGGQHIVAEGDELVVDFVGDVKSVDFTPLMVIDGAESVLDAGQLGSVKVTAKVLEALQGDKVVSLRYKAKKRVHTKRGHRQKQSKLQITSIK